jgi:hypothetical protein
MGLWKVYKIETYIDGKTIRTWDGIYTEAETWDEATAKYRKKHLTGAYSLYTIPDGWEYPYGIYHKQLEFDFK